MMGQNPPLPATTQPSEARQQPRNQPSETRQQPLTPQSETALQSDTLQHQLREVRVSDQQRKPLDATFTGNERLFEKDFSRTPAMLGEKDIMQTIRQLSGIQSVSEGNSGLYVRGGSSGQNLFLLDGMELLNPSHLMGIFSVFNPGTTGSVSVYKGQAPVNLQGRLSSTITVNSKDPTAENQGLTFNVGTITSTASWVKQLCNGKLDITTGLRKSYLETIGTVAGLFLSDQQNYFKSNNYRFYDFNGKATYHVDADRKLTLSWYTGNDKFAYVETGREYEATNAWGNDAVTLQYTHMGRKHSPNTQETAPFNLFKSTLAYHATHSGFKGDIISYNMQAMSSFKELQWKNEWEQNLNHHRIHAGISLSGQFTMPMDMMFAYNNDTLQQYHAYLNGLATLFAGDYISALSGRLNGYAGLRFSVNKPLVNNQPIGSQKLIYTNLSPVFSLSYLLTPTAALKLSASINDQHVHLAALGSVPIPNDIWVPVTAGLPPETASQLTLGYMKQWGSDNISLEVYGKRMDNQLIFNLLTDNADVYAFEDRFFHGTGLAYGIDFSAEATRGAFTGQISYSYSRSKRSFPDILNGEWFNDKYDRPHDLNILIAYTPNKTWDFAANWVYASGSNMNLPAGRWWLMGQIMNDYDTFNGFRLPDFHRLDVSANWHLPTKRFKRSVINFSIINVYNRANPYFIRFKVYQENNRYNLDIRSKQVSLFPILPSISWQVSF